MGGRGVAYTVLVWKPEGKKHLGNPGLKGRILFKGILSRGWVGGGGMDWIELA